MKRTLSRRPVYVFPSLVATIRIFFSILMVFMVSLSFFLSPSIVSAFSSSTLEPYNLVRFVQNSPLSSRISSETTSQWSKQFGQIPYSACRLVMSAQQQSDTRMTIMFSISLSLFLSLSLYIGIIPWHLETSREKSEKYCQEILTEN